MDEGVGAVMRGRRRTVLRGLWAVAAAFLVAGCGPEPQPRPPQPQPVVVEKPRCVLRDFRSATRFATEAWAIPDPRFNVGEPLRIQLRVSAPAYVNLFHVSTSCKVTRLIRNRFVKEATIVNFPEGGMSIVVKPPAGDEAFYVVATRKEIDVLAGADILRGGEVASLDMSPAQFYSRLEQATGRINPDDLSMTTLRTSIFSH